MSLKVAGVDAQSQAGLDRGAWDDASLQVPFTWDYPEEPQEVEAGFQ